MRQIFLFIAPLCLAACSIQPTQDRDPNSTVKFIEGYYASLTLNQIIGSAATLDQVKTIASKYVYYGAKNEFRNNMIAGYKPSLQEGVDIRGNKTLTLDAGAYGSALFVFNLKDRVREAIPLTGTTIEGSGKTITPKR